MLKQVIITVLTVLSLALPALADHHMKTGVAEQEIMMLDRQWGEAIYKRDTATLERLLDATLYHVHATGRAVGKAEFIDSLEDGMRSHDPIVPMKVQVRLYGTTAVSTGQFKMVARRKGMDKPMVDQMNSYIHVWIKTGTGWRLAVHQATAETAGMPMMKPAMQPGMQAPPGMQPGMMMPGHQH